MIVGCAVASEWSDLVASLTDEEILDVALELMARRPPETSAEIAAGLRFVWRVTAVVTVAPAVFSTSGS